MLFNSFVFAGIFLPICLLFFWSSPTDGLKRNVLLAFSLIFYGYWYPPYLVLLVGLVGIAWACALAAERSRSTAPVWIAAVLLLGALAFFKYAGFLSQVALDLGADSSYARILPQVALPLDISFIVFQALGYVIDVHRKEFHAERSFSVMLLFKAFFPQLIAGPICRAHELIPQLKGHFAFSLSNLLSGLGIFAVGLFLKLVFADSLAPLVDKLFLPDATHTAIEAWAAAIGFGVQIFADFWGYSTMAVGLALMFGVDIPINFRLPYLSTSIREFWRRWHITLSQWLRDYLYKSLGGSRHGQVRTIIALFSTMLLGGLWHGANYTFIVWGAIHGSVLAIEHITRRSPVKGEAGRSWSPLGLLSSAFGFSYTLVVVLVAWIYFRAADLGQANEIVKAMFAGDAGSLTPAVLQILAFATALVLVQAPAYRYIEMLRERTVPTHVALASAFVLTLLGVVLGAPEAVQFIYFEF